MKELGTGSRPPEGSLAKFNSRASLSSREVSVCARSREEFPVSVSNSFKEPPFQFQP